MYIEKENLLKLINSIETDCFEIEQEFTQPGKSFDLPDVRTGAIYNLIPMQKISHTNPEEVKLTITCARSKIKLLENSN